MSGAIQSGHPGPPPGLNASSERVLWTMKDGTRVEIRPIRPEDEPLMIKFHRGLSERSVYMRYFETLSLVARTAHARLVRICFANPERETVLVAVHEDPQSGEPSIMAVGRLSRLPDSNSAEAALLLSDDFQGYGLGTELLRRLIQAARDQRISRIIGEMLRDNTVMQRMLKNFGFRLRLSDARTVRAVLCL